MQSANVEGDDYDAEADTGESRRPDDEVNDLAAALGSEPLGSAEAILAAGYPRPGNLSHLLPSLIPSDSGLVRKLPTAARIVGFCAAIGLAGFLWAPSVDFVFNIAFLFLAGFSSAWGLFLSAIGFAVLLLPLASGLVLFALLRWIRSFSRADQVLVSDDSLSVGWTALGWNFTLGWQEITSVYLFCPGQTMVPDQWLVGFGTGALRPVTIRLPVLEDSTDKLLRCLKERAPWVSIDPALIEIWEPAIADSHTELWLKSLSTAPGEEHLMPLFPGATVRGRYLILNRLGVGGQGTAYLVQDEQSHSSERKDLVVLKETIFPVYVDARIRQEARQRFDRESELLRRLSHPQIVRFLDAFVEAHRGYLIIEYIEGDTLRRLVKNQGPLAADEAVELALQMCEILSYLHSLEPPVVHRDFTPENLMLNKDGVLKLLDFNVAREMESTRTSTVVGKQAYIPPEQFRAQPECRSDIYAMGATLFFLLTGTDPEPICESHPRDLLPDLSPDLDAIVARCTVPEADKRYANAEQIVDALRSIGG